MTLRIVAPIVLLAFCSSANAFYKLIPDGKEVTYNYTNQLIISAIELEARATVFNLRATLHVQSDDKTLKLKLSNAQYMPSSTEEEDGFIDIPAEAAMLEKSFQLKYSPNGKVAQLITEANEPIFVTNIKKAISNCLQMDMEKLNFEKNEPQVFTSKESTLAGMMDMFYHAQPTNGDVFIQKTDNTPDDTIYTYMYSNLPAAKDASNPSSLNRLLLYNVTKEHDYHIVKKLIARNDIVLSPTHLYGDALTSVADQKFNLVSVTPIEKKLTAPNASKTFNDLTYYMYDLMSTGTTIMDITNGRRKYDADELIKQTSGLLFDLVDYFENNQITERTPDFQKTKLLNILMQMLTDLDYAGLKNFYTTLLSSDDSRAKMGVRIFYKILPQIGTLDSSKYIIHLAESNTIDLNTITEMLITMPQSIRNPNQKFMSAMSHLFALSSKNETVVRQAKIAYSHLVGKTIQMSTKLRQNIQQLPEEQQGDALASKDISKYVTILIEKLKACTTDNDKMLQITLLGNMHIASAADDMISLIKGKWFHKQLPLVKVRFMDALITILGNDVEKINDVFWPILMNRSENDVVRSIAMSFVLENSSSRQILMMYWWVTKEPSLRLYQYFHSLLVGMSDDNKMPSRMPMAKRITRYLRQIPPVKYDKLCHYWQMGTHDEDDGSDHELSLSFLRSSNDEVLRFKYAMHTSLVNSCEELHVHISGMDMSLLKAIEIDTEWKSLFNMNKLQKAFADLMYNNDNLIISVTRIRDSFVLQQYFYGNGNVQEILNVLKYVVKDTFHVKDQVVQFDYSQVHREQYIASELGLPLKFTISTPSLASLQFSFNGMETEDSLGIKISSYAKLFIQSTVSLSFYNPMADMWQGLTKYQSLDASIPFNVEVVLKKHSLQLTWLASKNRKEEITGIKSHTDMAFFHGEYINQNGVKLNETDKVYNFPQSNNDLLGAMFYNVKIQKKRLTEMFFSEMQTNDYTLMLDPDRSTSVARIDLTCAFNQDYSKSEFILLPGINTKLNVKLRTQFDRRGLTPMTLELDLVEKINAGQTRAKLTGTLTAIRQKRQLSFCLDGSSKVNSDMVEIENNYGIGEEGEPSCKRLALHVTATVSRLDDQDDNPQYGSCNRMITRGLHGEKSFDCYYDHWAYRNYTYNIRSEIDGFELRQLKDMFNQVKENLKEHYTHLGLIDDDIKEDEVSVRVIFPINGDSADTYWMRVSTRNDLHIFSDLPNPLRIKPANFHYPQLFYWMRNLQLFDTCTVSDGKITTFEEIEHNHDISNEWSLLLGNSLDKPTSGVWIKEAEENISVLKVEYNEKMLTITPDFRDGKHKFRFDLNGAVLLENKGRHVDEWFHYFWQEEEGHGVVVIFCQNLGTNIVFNGHGVTLEMPQMSHKWYGTCSKKSDEA